MPSKNSPLPPPTGETFDTRVEEVLRALYWHLMTTNNLLDLNPIYRYPFPLTIKRRGAKQYRKSTVLSKLLRRLTSPAGDDDPLVAVREYSTKGLRRLPYSIRETEGSTIALGESFLGDMPKRGTR